MATIKFYAQNGSGFLDLTGGGSGLGFFKTSFGISVPVGEYATKCYVTNSAGTISGAEVQNVVKTHTNSGSPDGGTNSYLLTELTNADATLRIRFENASPVRTLNTKLRIYDRSNINNGPSGVTCYAATIVHADPVRNNNGSGNSSWSVISGSGSVLNLWTSPGSGGLSPSGSLTTDTIHDFFVIFSPTPDSIGSKTFAGYVSTEYI